MYFKNEESINNLKIIHGNRNITNELVSAVKNAKDYIFTIGGRSRNSEYLEAIENRMERGNIRYVRVITGSHIRHQLHVHLKNTMKDIEAGYLLEERFGNLLATNDMTFIALQDPKKTNLNTIIKIKDSSIANVVREYIVELFGQSNTDLDNSFISRLCKKCAHNI